jgi:hypothetical protein
VVDNIENKDILVDKKYCRLYNDYLLGLIWNLSEKLNLITGSAAFAEPIIFCPEIRSEKG